jgi:hypothetical protein
MPAPRQPQQLAEILNFHPEWWTDPVPPWFLQGLDRGIQVELIATQLEGHLRNLEARVEVARKSLEIIQRVK